ncbi:MAG: biopolymer transporter ExbD [Bacteroidota bacterium]|nr:biopolymer transporter ExbD [Bacteroidota bacterium]
MKFEMSNKPLSTFSLASLTDIVMLLLVFFLLTSQFVIQSGVKVKLPGAKNNEQVTTSRVVVTITENKKIYIGKDEVPLAALGSKFGGLFKKNAEENLIIRADKNTDINSVIQVIDAAKGAGISKFTIETEKELH